MPVTYDFTNGDDHYNAKYAGDFRLHMLDGKDWLRVTAGNVTATMGNGDDCVRIDSGQLGVFGQAGNDWFAQYGGVLHADGGDGNDRFVLYGGRGTMDGGLGNDRFDIRADGLNVNLQGGDGNDSFVNYRHTTSGTASGGAGNDGFVGFGSGVTLAGGAGDDTYIVDGYTYGRTPDTLGRPTIVENAGEGQDTVIVTGGGSYSLPDNVENLVARDPFPTSELVNGLIGNDLDNVIRGSAGADYISGGLGNDVLLGGEGNDFIGGGDENDVLIGGPGLDVMYGGDGVDRFVFWTGDSPEDPDHPISFNYYYHVVDTDIIDSFEATDIIDLSNIDANTEVAGVQHFTLSPGTGHDVGKIYWQLGTDGLIHVQGYTDSDSVADFNLTINSYDNTPLLAANFFLGG